jgi:uncharacterized protein (TIGR03083 family)
VTPPAEVVGPGQPGVDHLAALRAEGRRLVDVVRTADLDAAVPGLEWDVRTVAVHTGAVHRWAADVVHRRLATNETGGSSAFAPAGLSDGDLPGWLAEGLEALVSTLEAAPADLGCFTFVPDIDARTFWRRRQAHETAVHRADVQAGAGCEVEPVDAAFAQDGLAEVVGAFAREPGFASTRRGTLLLAADDGPAWRVRFGDGPHRVETGAGLAAGAADAVVSGTSAALYLWAWNRPAPVEVCGREDVVALWRLVRVT